MQLCSVESCAVSSDLSMLPGLDSDPAKLDHGLLERLEEERLVLGEAGHRRPRRGVGVELLVGGEQAEAAGEVGVVGVVEGGRGDGVHVDGDGRRDVARARRHQLPRVRRVVGRVHAAADAAVQPAGEARAVREADGVRAGERHHVEHGEVVLGEYGGEVLDAHVRAWQLAGDAAGLGDEAV
ncbi:Os09g0507550 [Oryza sativa Japonica Group]|uniref:Os09g0507550 protein n=1 Tax=Oryza sativa subsp. japonica TaxID=39947 RepID=A0A0P0XQA3_ORYSJ|nr:hypothetical protein EE612_048829 [Oryza sativa]BAT08876.1 Os09g0507550 [Oryza sativa Japonica Group]